ncbi:MAG: hypothetical protein ACRD0J_04805 [Acidimicrobiales bacterium]
MPTIAELQAQIAAVQDEALRSADLPALLQAVDRARQGIETAKKRKEKAEADLTEARDARRAALAARDAALANLIDQGVPAKVVADASGVDADRIRKMARDGDADSPSPAETEAPVLAEVDSWAS